MKSLLNYLCGLVVLATAGCAPFPAVQKGDWQPRLGMMSAPVPAATEVHTPGTPSLNRPHLKAEPPTQYPVTVIRDERNGVVVARYVNPDPTVYSGVAFDGGDDPAANYWRLYRVPNASITNFTPEGFAP